MNLHVWYPTILKKDHVLCLTDFFTKMVKRIVAGQLRYEKQGPTSYLKWLEQETKAYKKTGNSEHLINAANYAYLESVFPSHPKFHFDPTAKSIRRKES